MMDTTQWMGQINEVLESLLNRGSRYQIEKIVTIAVYAVVSVGSLIWALSGNSQANALNAGFEVGRLADIDDQNLYLSNSGDAWSTVRVVLNRMYLWTAPRVDARSRVTLQPADFDYYYYIPRPWGRHGWEQLEESERPGAKAPGTLRIEHVRIWAKEGSLDIVLGPDGKPVGSNPQAEQ